MAFDSFSLRFVVEECQEAILGGQIRHIEQWNATDVVLKVSRENEVAFLLLSAHPVHARAHLTARPPRTKEAFHFARFLMQHLMRGTITRVAQVGLDRILHLDILPSGMVEKAPKRLIGEFMGKHSNLILVDLESQRVLESIKHVDETMSRRRQVLPGLPYEPPPMQSKLNPWALTREAFVALFAQDPQHDPERVLLRHLDGFSPSLCQEVVLRARPDAPPEELWEAFQSVLRELGSPHVLLRDERPVAVAPLRLHLPDAIPRPFESMSAALEYYHARVIELERLRGQRQALLQVLQRRRAAIEEKIHSLEMELARAENAEQWRIYGELLTANLYRIRRGQREVEVQNYYEPEAPTVVLELDPALTPSQNAQQYFKRYKKARRARTVLANLISDQEAQLQRLEHYQTQVEQAPDLEALEQVHQRLIQAGLVSDPRKHRKKSKEERSFRHYVSVNGYSIYVGRSPRENDLLTFKVANRHDMWLHAKQIPGAHVIIRNPEKKEQIPMPTLLEAARTAAFFSQAGKSENVPVDYTWVKYVTKPKGSPPGYVHYTHEKTLFVNPERPRGRDQDS